MFNKQEGLSSDRRGSGELSGEALRIHEDAPINLASADLRIEKWESTMDNSDERDMLLLIDELEALKSEFSSDEETHVIQEINNRIERIKNLLDPTQAAVSVREVLNAESSIRPVDEVLKRATNLLLEHDMASSASGTPSDMDTLKNLHDELTAWRKHLSELLGNESVAQEEREFAAEKLPPLEEAISGIGGLLDK